MRQHPFSTPDGNKTYCKTCGYTREAGNHVKVVPFAVARRVMYRAGDAVAFKGGSGTIARIEQQANGSRAVTFHAVIDTGSGEVRRSVNGLSPVEVSGS